MKLIKSSFDLYAMLYAPTKEELLDIEGRLKDNSSDERIAFGNNQLTEYLGQHPYLPYDLDEESGLLVIPVQGVLIGGRDLYYPGLVLWVRLYKDGTG